jgi:hypothetical protein
MPLIPWRLLRAPVAALFVPLILVAGDLPQSVLAENQPAPAVPTPANSAFSAWSEQFAAETVRLDPQLATQKQYFAGPEQNALDRELTPLTSAHRAREAGLRRAGVARLKQWDGAALNASQRTSAAVMRSALNLKSGSSRHWNTFSISISCLASTSSWCGS